MKVASQLFKLNAVLTLPSTVISGTADSTRNLKVTGTEFMDLPWSDLKNKLSLAASLVDTSNLDYVEQCYPIFADIPSRISHHDLVAQPSGLCMNIYTCGFEQCNPAADENLTTLERAQLLRPFRRESPQPFPDLPSNWLEINNPSFNLPSKVLYPQGAGDVATAVNFAKEHNVELSVKNSGHSYQGASTKKDTLLINMKEYNPYSPTGLVECSTSTETSVEQGRMAQDLGNQPCMLALARGKKATLRVSGGENFGTAYGSVKEWNEQQESYKYDLVGGYAGTVTPMGWTWSGGLSASTQGRMHGFGVDQVLQIEMLLPNGLHVKFGPTSWEDAEGYLYPKTTKVSGVCNEKPEEEEDKWVWSSCPEDINFDDLWFAIRGGGGGTWGVILSLHYQLHDYLPMEVMYVPDFAYPSSSVSTPCVIQDPPQALQNAFWRFSLDFFLDPGVLNITNDASNACGWLVTPNSPGFHCHGDGSGNVAATTWKNYLVAQNETLASSGVPVSVINQASECELLVKKYPDYAESILITEGPHAGKAVDDPPPSYVGDLDGLSNLLVPMAWILENKDIFSEILPVLGPYFAFGERTKYAHDQTTSLSDAHREAGLMIFIRNAGLFETPDLALQVCDFTGDNYPSHLGGNHLGPNTFGRLKSDWTKPCPVDLTYEESQDQCVSAQEAIFGTEKLARLEAIKEAIDPNYMFNCNRCIGNNKVLEDTPSKAPTASDATSAWDTWNMVGVVIASMFSSVWFW